jgi:hypothetical protein
MAPSERNPSAGGAGAPNDVLLTTANISEDKPSAADLQARLAFRHCALSLNGMVGMIAGGAEG